MAKKKTAVTKSGSGGNDPYAELVKRVGGLLKNAIQVNLQVTRRVGKEVAELVNVKRQATYGYKKVEQLAADLTVSGYNVKAETLYAAKAIFEKLDAAQYKLAQEGGISVRSLIPLCAERVTPEVRTKVLEQAAQERMNRAQISDMIDRELGVNKQLGDGKQTEPETAMGPKQAMKAITGLKRLFDSLNERRPTIAEPAKVIADQDDVKKMAAALDRLEDIQGCWDNLRAHIDKELAGAKKPIAKMQKATKGS